MQPDICLLNLCIPLYPFCVATGFLIGTIVATFLGKKNNISENQVFVLICFVEVGVIIGGKILFLLVNINNIHKIIEAFGFIALFTKTGFVFYGGLIGGLLLFFIGNRVLKLKITKTLPLIITVTPLIHAFGRLGCFCAGCCYGKEWNKTFGGFINGEFRFPVQLLESFANLILFFILLSVFIYISNFQIFIIPIYFIGYGIIRLITESFRGDITRGQIGFLSISSWLSILSITVGIIYTIKELLNMRKGTNNE